MQDRVTKEIMNAFREMEDHQFEGLGEEDVPNCRAMFARHDPLAHGYDTFTAHYPPEQAEWFEGEHRVNDDIMKQSILPRIIDMLA